MDASLEAELISSLIESVSCRETQTRQLACLLEPGFPNPSTIVIHGFESTGKSLTLKAVLESISTPYAIIRSQECITFRHLLERAISACEVSLMEANIIAPVRGLDGRCESLSTFVVQLQKLLEQKGKFILVFDGIDQQRESLPTLLPAIVRLGEIIADLTTILVVTAPQDRALHIAGLPYIHFPPYTRAESLSIVSSKSPQLDDLYLPNGFPDETNHNPSIDEADLSWLWPRFCAAVWDSLGQGVARNIVAFRTACLRLWKSFIQPILDGKYMPREFSKLMVKNRSLFQNDAALDESIDTLPFSSLNTKSTRSSIALPYCTAYLLLAAYLGSHTPPRHDPTIFSKSSLASRRKKKGGASVSRGRTSKHRKVSRHLLGPQAFPLERLFAIFHSILPTKVSGGSAEVMAQVATLKGLRLLVRSGVGEEVGGGKWRVACGGEFVKGVAREVGFELEEFLVE